MFRRAEELFGAVTLWPISRSNRWRTTSISPPSTKPEKLFVVEDRIECQLRLSQHEQLTGELDALTAATPRGSGAGASSCWPSTGRSVRRTRSRRSTVPERTSSRVSDSRPSPELHDLERRILEQDPELDLADAPPRAAATEPSDEIVRRPFDRPVDRAPGPTPACSSSKRAGGFGLRAEHRGRTATREPSVGLASVVGWTHWSRHRTGRRCGRRSAPRSRPPTSRRTASSGGADVGTLGPSPSTSFLMPSSPYGMSPRRHGGASSSAPRVRPT